MTVARRNTALEESAAAFLHRFEGLRARLPGDTGARAEAAEHLRRTGLPGPREEAWKYTSLRPMAESRFYEALTEAGGQDAATPEDLLDGLGLLDAPRLVFVDGRRREDACTLPDRARVRWFSQAGGFGRLARPGNEAMVALNTMLAEDGAVVDVSEDVDGGTLQLVSLGGDLHGTPSAFHPRHRITLARGARLVLVEVAHGRGAYLHNPVMEVEVAAGATLTHVKLQDEGAGAFHLSTTYADVAEDGVYDSFCLTLGGRLARNETHARLGGARGAVHLNGAQLLAGTQHADFTTVVHHAAPNCASRQTVKNVLSGRSRGVFQGRIEVDRIAQKTDGYQMNQALLLSPDAEIDAKPELQIYADDVKCSHGATVGELDAEQLFYLRSRGVPVVQARAMLVRAFLAEALDPITHEGARALLEVAVERWWRRQEEVEAT